MKKTSLCTVLFVCSLVLNAFLIGLLLAGPGKPERMKRADRMEQAAARLDPTYRNRVQEVLGKNRERMNTRMDTMGSNLDRITEVLSAPKFDEARLKAVHNDIAKSDAAMKSGMLATVTAIAKILPDAERIKFFKDSAPPHPAPPHLKGPPRK